MIGVSAKMERTPAPKAAEVMMNTVARNWRLEYILERTTGAL
jgi:hypothetical protein